MPSMQALQDAVAKGVAQGMTSGNKGGEAGGLGNTLFTMDMMARAASQMTAAAQSLTQWKNIASNTSLPASLQHEFQRESLPFGFGEAARTARNLSDAYISDGANPFGGVSRSEALRRSDANFALNQQTGAARFRADTQVRQLAYQASVAHLRSQSLGALGAPTIARFDQSTVGGFYAQQEEMQMAPHRANVEMAQAEANAARQAHGVAQQRLQESQRRASADQATAASDRGVTNMLTSANWNDPALSRPGRANSPSKWYDALPGTALSLVNPLLGMAINKVSPPNEPGAALGPSRAQIAIAQNKSNLSAQQAERSAAAAQTDLTQEQQASRAAIQAEANARQSLIEGLRAEANMMQQRAQRLEGVAGRLGNMQPVDQQLAVNAMARAQRHGWNSLTQQERSAVAGIDPTTAQRLSQQAGENSDAWRQLQQMGGNTVSDTPGSIAQNREAAIALQDRAQKEERERQQRAASQLDDVLTRGANSQAAAIEKMFERLVDRLNTTLARILSGLHG